MSGYEQDSTSDRYMTPGSGDAWAKEAASTGKQGTQRIIAAEEVLAPPEVAAALRLAPNTRVVLRQRVMLLDGHAVELVDSYYPSSIAAGTPLADCARIPGGSVTLLANLGYTPDRAIDDITARRPTLREQHELRISERDPVIVLTRLTFAADGTPFEYSIMTMTAAGRHLRYQTKA
ncbi:GntR family transcriptional regulator [Micromonospora sp. NPDC048871]|uniref:GntR family transcriptional regulator n=1 Tax=Micromonospora sp. NPDC048871 TaxID=3364259 RepID=UPI00371D5CCC